jgi:hypothetical protein
MHNVNQRQKRLSLHNINLRPSLILIIGKSPLMQIHCRRKGPTGFTFLVMNASQR